MTDKLQKFADELGRLPNIWSTTTGTNWREVSDAVSSVVDDYTDCYGYLEEGLYERLPGKEVLLARQKILIDYAMMLERKLAQVESQVSSLKIQNEGLRGGW